MAAKKNPKRPPLTDTQRLAIHDLYVVEGLDAGEIAARLGIGTDQASREMRRPKNAADKLAVDENPDVLAAKRAREAEEAQDRVVVSTLCVRVSKSYLRAHLKAAKRLEAAAGDQATPLLGKGGIASALGSPAPVIEKGRLSVGLTTEKTSSEGEELRRKHEALFEAIHARVAQRDQPPGPADGPGGVQSMGGVGAEPLADPGVPGPTP